MLPTSPNVAKSQHELAGALDLVTGALLHGVATRPTNALFRNRLTLREAYYPAERYTRLSVVVDPSTMRHGRAVAPWLAAHPRLTWRWLPTDGPRAHPIERAVGDVHDLCTRHPTRKRLGDLVADVEAHLQGHGPWPYTLSELDAEPAVTAAVETMAAEQHAKIVA